MLIFWIQEISVLHVYTLRALTCVEEVINVWKYMDLYGYKCTSRAAVTFLATLKYHAQKRSMLFNALMPCL